MNVRAIDIDLAELFGCKVIELSNESEWLEMRRSGIGASDTASIFGAGYAESSPITVWESKTGEPRGVSPAMQRIFDRSHRMESVIAAEFVAETGFEIVDPGEYTIFRSKDERYQNLFATLDRVVLDPDHGPIPLELKNIHGRNWAEYEDDEAPLKHQIQCQHQMAVTGAEFAVLACLIGGADLKIFLIERNERFIETMVSQLDAFVALVESKTLPPVDKSEATAKALARIYPADDTTSIDLPPVADQWAEHLATAKEELKAAKKRVVGIENEIKAAIGEATRGNIPSGGGFTWKQQTRKSYVVEESTYRVLRMVKK